MRMDEQKKPAKERRAKEPRPPKPAREPKRRERVLDAADTYAPAAGEDTMNDIFRKRLAYLMNGNNSLGRAVNIQELADAVGVSRPAIRKYLKPKGGAPTTPSAATVCEIARFFSTTPDFMLGFDAPDTDAARMALESEYYNALGLNQHTIDALRALRARQSDERTAGSAAALLAMLDKLICSFAADAERLLGEK